MSDEQTIKADSCLPGYVVSEGDPPSFEEHYGVDSATRLVERCGDKFRPVAPMKLVKMLEPFTVKMNPVGMFISGRSGDYLGLNQNNELFVVRAEDLADIWRSTKRQ